MNKLTFGRLLCLTLYAATSFAQPKTIAERLGYPTDSKLLIILADDVAR
jgi:hypothetical protein